MQHLRYVTITGADDTTPIEALIDLSAEYPFVEWGILVSRRQEGSYRFPGREWISQFCSTVSTRPEINVSMHMCGQWVRKTLMGENIWHEMPPGIAERAQRIQINTHAEPHGSTVAMVNRLADLGLKEFIFQWDGVNDHLARAAAGYGVRAAALFDTSGGAGILPSGWPRPDDKLPCGYAGGLGPDNVVQQLRMILTVCDVPFWIDMERRVRIDDDSRLDMLKVRKVLQNVRGMIERGEIEV